MPGKGSNGKKKGASAGVLIASTVSLLALPSAVLAFSSRFETDGQAAKAGPDALRSDRVASQLVPPIPVRSLARGQMFRFTPAGTAGRLDRSVTVAVRVDPMTAQTIMVRAPRSSLVGAQTSAVTQPLPCPFIKNGTPSSTLTAHNTLVFPISMSAEPSG